MERSEQELQRREKLQALHEQGWNYPNDASVDSSSETVLASEVVDKEDAPRFTVAGRLVQMRMMGKASFAHLLDSHGRLQLYVRQSDVGEEAYSQFKDFDLGDIIEAKGYLFLTKTGEKTLYVESIRILNKCLIPLPEKWHGLTDVEARYRHRYVDLIANPSVREVFRARARILSSIRHFLDSRGYLEVETPVLHYIPGGADAKPFETYYNALDCSMSLRISLELPLKKLVVGGLDRVYELSRVFRNEGLSKKHNPEFTMLEFYQAYARFEDLMALTEELFVELAKNIVGSLSIPFGDQVIDFTPPWPRISMVDSLYEYGGVATSFDLHQLSAVQQVAQSADITLEEPDDWGRSLETLWGELVEPKLKNPVFITHHPFSISPLARKNADNPAVVDRFELIIAGMEMANAFSELNDPIDQRQRFETQAERKKAGDEQANDIDEDFLRALEYGLPPTAGEGIGIDRLVMLLTNTQTIRDVLLFPQLRPRDDLEHADD